MTGQVTVSVGLIGPIQKTYKGLLLSPREGRQPFNTRGSEGYATTFQTGAGGADAAPAHTTRLAAAPSLLSWDRDEDSGEPDEMIGDIDSRS